MLVPEKEWHDKHLKLAGDEAVSAADREIHARRVARSLPKITTMETMLTSLGDTYQVGLTPFGFFDVNGALDATARPTERAERGDNRTRTALANAFKSESGIMTITQRTAGTTPEERRICRLANDRLTMIPLVDPGGCRGQADWQVRA